MTKRENMNEDREENTPSSKPSAPANMKSSPLEGAEDFLRNELLPNIPNDLALQVIAPKLSPRAIHILSLVSPTWREAIHRRSVYDARVRSHSTETFVVLTFIYNDAFDYRDWTYKIRLYSLHDNSAYDLPPIRFRLGYKCISLDGKLYMLGGGRGLCFGGPPCNDEFYSEMFMIDLAGQKQWKQCASMQQPRYDFGAGVLNGKIYVFGGMTGDKFQCKSEVDDPKIDAWSSLADMIVCRMGHQVAGVGGELFVYGGKGPDSEIFSFPPNLVAYNPVKNEWRQIVHSHTGDPVYHPLFSVFVAQGKFHRITERGIDVYDTETNSWRGVHSFLGLRDNSYEVLSRSVLPLGDDILMFYHSYRGWNDRPRLQANSIRLIQSTGFGSTNREVVGQEIANSRLSYDLRRRFDRVFEMFLIQL